MKSIGTTKPIDDEQDEVSEQTKDDLLVASFLQKTDRIISDFDVVIDDVIKVGGHSEKVAFTDKSTNQIWINFRKMLELSRDSKTNCIPLTDEQQEIYIALLKGLNYHELSHLLFTRNIASFKYDETLRMLHNAIEDGRIETLFTLLYPKAKKYFENCCVRILSKGALPETFLSVYPRHLILPSDFVAYFEKLFETKYGVDKTKKAKELMDKFITSKSLKEHEQIIIELSKLLNWINKGDIKKYLSQGIGEFRSGRSGQALSRLSQQLADAIKQMLKNGQGSMPTPVELSQKEKDAINKLNKIDERLEKLDKKLKDECDKGTFGFNSRDEKKLAKLQVEINKLLQERRELLEKFKCVVVGLEGIQQKVMSQIKPEILSDIKAIGLGNGANSVNLKLTITAQHKSISNKLRNLIRLLKNDLKDGYVKNKKKGKLDLRKCSNYKKSGSLRLFKKYMPNRVDKSKLGVFLLIDSSGSMNNPDFEKALSCSWVLTDSLEKVGNGVSIIQFSDKFTITKEFNEQGNYSRQYSDGTNPLEALQYVLKKTKDTSEYKNWIVFVLTDGGWGNETESEAVMTELNKKAETILIHFGGFSNENKAKLQHKAKHFVKIDDINQICDIFKETIKKVQRSIQQQIIRGQI